MYNMDEMIEFESSEDEEIWQEDAEMEPVSTRSSIAKSGENNSNFIHLQVWKDVLENHCSQIDSKKEHNSYKTSVNSIIVENKLDATQIKCKKWHCSLNNDLLPRPLSFMKCSDKNQVHNRNSKEDSSFCQLYIPSERYVRNFQQRLQQILSGNNLNQMKPNGNKMDSANCDDEAEKITLGLNQHGQSKEINLNHELKNGLVKSGIKRFFINKNSNQANKFISEQIRNGFVSQQNIKNSTYNGQQQICTNKNESKNQSINSFGNKNTSFNDKFQTVNAYSKDLFKENYQFNDEKDNNIRLNMNFRKSINGSNYEDGSKVNGITFPFKNQTKQDMFDYKERFERQDAFEAGSNRPINGFRASANVDANRNENPFAYENFYKNRNHFGTNEYDERVGQKETLGAVQNRPISGFRTATSELKIQSMKKDQGRANQTNQGLSNCIKKTLGTTKTRPVNSRFVPPIKKDEDDDKEMKVEEPEEEMDERYKGIDKVMIERIENEIMDRGKPVHWNDIAGLTFAKNTIQEIIVWPLLRPDIFTGLRRPPKGILLFGPPGTGKTLIGKCVAAQSKSTFFCISASTLTSKWYGEGEKMVRALFAVARVHQPSIIFIDEIDSLLCQRSDQENETSRRLKTEFLIQLDGAATLDDDLVLVIGATNRPQELDEAARRRLVKRLYIPLPETKARCEIVAKLMSNINNSLTADDIEEIGRLTETYSGADMANLCKDASLGPVRAIDLSRVDATDVRPINVEDFRAALRNVRPSVSQADLSAYEEWNNTFGSGGL